VGPPRGDLRLPWTRTSQARQPAPLPAPGRGSPATPAHGVPRDGWPRSRPQCPGRCCPGRYRHGCHCFFLHVRQYVRLGVHRLGNRGMPQNLLDYLGMYASAADRGLTVTGANVGQHRETLKLDNRPKQAVYWTTANNRIHMASDYESEGRRFESCRAHSRKCRKNSIFLYPSRTPSSSTRLSTDHG
jgi:hypothetical protein